MDIKTTTYKSLEWYIINETSTEKLLFLKDSLSEEIIKQVFNYYNYYNNYLVPFNLDYTTVWWKDSYIREGLNKVLLKKFLDVNDLNIMKTTLELDGAIRQTEDYVRLITKEEVESLPLKIKKTEKEFGYWTMSPNPRYFANAHVYVVYGTSDPGFLYHANVSSTFSIGAVRPVISLKSNTIIYSYNSGLIIDSTEEDRKERMRKKLEKIRNL